MKPPGRPSSPHRPSRPQRTGPRSGGSPHRTQRPPRVFGPGPDGLAQVSISRRGVERWQAGHPWIYRADLESASLPERGEVVRVIDTRGWFLGKAFYSPTSKIALRTLTLEDEVIDEAFYRRRLEAADALRRDMLQGERSYRVVHAESDGLPGLIVDRYGDYLSVQFLIAATDALAPMFVRLLVDHFQPKGIVNRSDVGVRAYEGLDQVKGVLHGEVPDTVPHAEGLVNFELDLIGGQKTGTFLDQRDNHVRAGAYAHGEALDCFSYLGGFAMQLATRASKVTAVEISEPACELIRNNAKLNGFDNVEVVAANAFDFLRDAVDEGRRFDTIVLDPPSFAKNKDAVEGAMRGYKEINLRALQLLRPGGILITASCTYHVNEERFEEMLESAAVDAKRRVQILERRGAGIDHPVLMRLRETRYLKCFVLRVF